MIDTVIASGPFEIGEEWDEVDLALLDYVELIRAYGISEAQAIEIAADRIPELYAASEPETAH